MELATEASHRVGLLGSQSRVIRMMVTRLCSLLGSSGTMTLTSETTVVAAGVQRRPDPSLMKRRAISLLSHQGCSLGQTPTRTIISSSHHASSRKRACGSPIALIRTTTTVMPSCSHLSSKRKEAGVARQVRRISVLGITTTTTRWKMMMK